MSNPNGNNNKAAQRPPNDPNSFGNGRSNAPANARVVKSSARTGTVSRAAARSAAKAVSGGGNSKK